MIKAPLTLQASAPLKIAIEAKIDGWEDNVDLNVQCGINFAQNDTNERLWQVILAVNFQGKDGAPLKYSGAIKYVGIILVEPNYPKENIGKMLAVTCPTMLYGSVRELVALLTGRGPHPVLVLPTVSFADNELTIPERTAAPNVEPDELAKAGNRFSTVITPHIHEQTL